MKILIVSDTHRDNRNFFEALEREEPVDIIVHCGDVEGSEYLYDEACDGDLYMVRGNNDFFSDLDDEEMFCIGELKVWLTHGHRYGVYRGYDILIDEAKSRGADIVMFGHTHVPVAEYINDVWVVNPGSLSYPRQEGRMPTYIIMEYERGKEPTFKLRCVPR